MSSIPLSGPAVQSMEQANSFEKLGKTAAKRGKITRCVALVTTPCFPLLCFCRGSNCCNDCRHEEGFIHHTDGVSRCCTSCDGRCLADCCNSPSMRGLGFSNCFVWRPQRPPENRVDLYCQAIDPCLVCTNPSSTQYMLPEERNKYFAQQPKIEDKPTVRNSYRGPCISFRPLSREEPKTSTLVPLGSILAVIEAMKMTRQRAQKKTKKEFTKIDPYVLPIIFSFLPKDDSLILAKGTSDKRQGFFVDPLFLTPIPPLPANAP